MTIFIQRRKLFQYSVLGGASFLVSNGLLNHKYANALSFDSRKERVYDWIFLYWMPYDNSLSKFGTPILEMLTKGVESDNILVVVQSKFSGDKQIFRNLITPGNIDTQKLKATNSGSEEVFTEYLKWAKSQFKAKKWAVIFLGHGGRLDEISPDARPIPGTTVTKWMNIQKLSNVLEKFNQEVDNRVELFFLQNCNKGTVEANYTFRNTARYTLSSQLILGAPNYYYEPLLKFIGRNPEIHGGQVAEKIMEFEPKNMYYSYTCVNNSALTSLSAKINPMIESVISSNINAINLMELKTYYYINERFVDIVYFFQVLTERSGAKQQTYIDFAKFLKTSVIYKLQKNGTIIDSDLRKEYQDFLVFCIFFPHSRQEIEKYRYLQVFSDLKLVKLFATILPN